MNKKSMMFIVGAICFSAFLFGAITSTLLNAQNESSVAVPSFTPPAFSFQKNLKLGDDSQDVRQLQIFLNGDVGTHISDSGIGSKGQESTYFGQLTENAVMRFQLKYGISATGFVGPLTRAQLNQLASVMVKTVAKTPISVTTTTGKVANSSSATSTFGFSGALPLSKEPLPRLYTVRPQQIRRGDKFTLIGAGFQIENTIHIGSETFLRVSPQDDSNISFTIPPTSAIQNGTYEVWIENSKGTSRVSARSVKLIVADNSQPASVISSVLPATVSGTETVTVIGTGFTSSGNDIVSGFGKIKSLPSNGTQITFSPRSLLTAETFARIPAGQSIKIDFYVINAGGSSNVFGSVNLKK